MQLKIYKKIVTYVFGLLFIASCSQESFSNADHLNYQDSNYILDVTNLSDNQFGKLNYKNFTIGDSYNASLLKRYTDIIEECFNAEEIQSEHGITFQIEEGAIAIISSDEQGFESYSGVRVGDNLQSIHSKHGNEKPEIINNPYGEKGVNIVLIYWYSPEKDKGVRYDVDNDIVSSISIGDASLEYMEGCA